MDRIVFQYEEESKEKLRKFKLIGALATSFIVLVIVFVAFFIFRPMAKKVRKSCLTFNRYNKKLKKQNREEKGG